MRATHARRGQATVELVLGAIVFVTLLLGGIHFAEFAQLALKVQDAQTFAVWEASGAQVLDFRADGTSSDGPFRSNVKAGGGVGADAEGRFQDFDGLSSASGGAVITRALTEGKAMKVTCEPVGAGVVGFRASDTALPYYPDVGGLHCSSEADVTAIRTPKAFLQNSTGDGWFKNEHDWVTTIKVCGTGFAKGGACPGSLTVLTGDWGYAGPEQTKASPLNSTTLYSAAVKNLFHPPAGAANAFAAAFAGGGPSSSTFYMSYRGIEDGYQESVGGEVPSGTYLTGGAGLGLVPFTKTGGNCFLGLPCP